MPRPSTYERGSKVTVADADDERVIVNVSETDALAETIHTRQVVLGPAGIHIHPIRIRYSWPSELDLMAELVGLRLRARWSGWNGEPFTADDQRHISVYERAVEPAAGIRSSG